MKLLADLHTHSKFSRFGHGKNTIEEMARRANELGLEELAITDHGYKHFFRTSFEKMLKARQIIDDINKWSKTKILLGIEADIINENGDLDIDDDTLALLDILIVGYHRMIPTNFAGYFGGQKNTSEAIEKATRAYLNAIDKYPVTFISHIDSILTTDLYRIGMACRDKGVYIEINNRHTKWTQSQIDDLIASDCMFVVSSDAHRFEDVGNAENAFELIKKYKIPEESVANVAFADEELTEDDKENRLYKNLYNSLRETNPKLYAEITATMGKQAEKSYSRAGAKGALSKEMEDELEKLAREQGIEDYERQDGNESITNYSQENYFEESSNAGTEKQDFEGEVDLKNDNYFESESMDYPGGLEDVNTENNEVYEEQTEQESVQENVSNKPSFHSHIEINPSKNDAFKQQSN
ncbi:MAG: PHP domain-containing protein, partial [Clostridia bacterium]|nr:PHP domain-containing protein [Clostridia bacterium]